MPNKYSTTCRGGHRACVRNTFNTLNVNTICTACVDWLLT